MTKAIADAGCYDHEARIFHALRDSMTTPEPLSHRNDQPGRTPAEGRQMFRAAARRRLDLQRLPGRATAGTQPAG